MVRAQEDAESLGETCQLVREGALHWDRSFVLPLLSRFAEREAGEPVFRQNNQLYFIPIEASEKPFCRPDLTAHSADCAVHSGMRVFCGCVLVYGITDRLQGEGGVSHGRGSLSERGSCERGSTRAKQKGAPVHDFAS